MISEKHCFLFVHRPKSGGNSISEALLPYSDDVKTVGPQQDGVDRFGVESTVYGTKKHTGLIQYRNVLPADLFRRMHKFSVIRNPFDWLISYQFSPLRIAMGKTATFDRDRFLNSIKRRQTLRSYICLSPESRLTDDIDTLLTFERLESDFLALCEKLDLPPIALKRRNKSDRRPYREYYDAELRKVVEEKFHEELEYGNYDF